MFKIILDLISVPLSNIFNKCIEMSYFPDLVKTARIVSIFKSNDPLLPNKYRPMSLLSVFSKLFEKYLCKQISKKERNSYVSNNVVSRSGYRLIFL